MATTDKRIILMPSPFAWMHELIAGSTEPLVTAAVNETFRFDNLAKGGRIAMKNPAGADQGGENVDIVRADGAITRFGKFNLVLDGTDESDITPADASDDNTGLGTIEIITNEAPLPTTINSWTAFIKTLKEKVGSLWLITVATGFTYASRELATPKVDGWIRMIGKITNDLELDLSENQTLKLTFDSYKANLTDVDNTLLALTDFTAINWKGKGKNFTPPDLTSGEADDLLLGKVVVKTDVTYTY